MLDIKLIRESPERFKKAAADKHFDADIDKLLQIEKQLSDAKKKLQEINTEKNTIDLPLYV